MIERRDHRPPVTYTTFKARDLGSDTAELFSKAAKDAYDRFQPQAMLVGASCTAELIQDDPGGLMSALDLPIPVVPLELPSYQRKENWGAAETFYQLVRGLIGRNDGTTPVGSPRASARARTSWAPPRSASGTATTSPRSPGCWTSWDRRQRRRPDGRDPHDLQRIPRGRRQHPAVPRDRGQPPLAGARVEDARDRDGPLSASTPPASSSRSGRNLRGRSAPLLDAMPTRLPWWSRSVDSNYLTGKRVFVFGDGTHALAAARVAKEEMGFEVVGLGTYPRVRPGGARAANSTASRR